MTVREILEAASMLEPTERELLVDRRLRLLHRAELELNEAADEYDEARTGLGDRFVSAIDSAIESIIGGPQRWPALDARHHRVLVRRFPFMSTDSMTPRSSSWRSLIIGEDPATGLALAEAMRPAGPLVSGWAGPGRPGSWTTR